MRREMNTMGEVISENYVSNNIMNMQYVEALQVATTLSCDADGILIGVVSGGNIRFSIGGVNYKVMQDEMFVLHGVVKAEEVKCSKAFKGYFISVEAKYLTTINVDTADFIAADMMVRTTLIYPLEPSQAEMMNELAWRMICLSNKSNVALQDNILLSLSEAYMYLIISVIGSRQLDVENVRSNSSLMVLKRFSELLKDNYILHKNVDYYASQLGISSKYLSIVCRKYRGVTASHVIDGVIIRHAKMLLKQQGVSVQEVAKRLNFPSQSFFGKYFKQRVGISPSRYKGDA